MRLFAVFLIVPVLLLAALPSAAPAAGEAAAARARLRIATKPFEPLVIKAGDRWTGFSIDLWEALARELELEYDWVEVSSVTDQLRAVETGEADAAIAGISMTAERERVVDFSFPYFRSGLQIMTAMPGGNTLTSEMGFLAAPALRRILVTALILAVILAHVVWLVERRSNPAFQKGYLRDIGEGLWAVVLVVATGEYGDRDLPNVVRRLMVAALWLLGVAMIAQFTATVTTALTVQQLTSSINSPEDLPGKRVAAVRGTTGAQYLAAHAIAAQEVAKIADAFTMLEQGQVDAVVYDAPVLLYYAANGGKGRVQIAGSIFNEDTYGIALPTGSPHRKPINEKLLKLREDGTYEELYTKWFGSR
jgi:polar amino acid transport system substrate-binding protein